MKSDHRALHTNHNRTRTSGSDSADRAVKKSLFGNTKISEIRRYDFFFLQAYGIRDVDGNRKNHDVPSGFDIRTRRHRF